MHPLVPHRRSFSTPLRTRPTIGRMSSGRTTAGALFVAAVGLITLALNAIAVPQSPTFQTIGGCLLLAGLVSALGSRRRHDT